MAIADRLEYGRLGQRRLAIRRVVLSDADLRAILLIERRGHGSSDCWW